MKHWLQLFKYINKSSITLLRRISRGINYKSFGGLKFFGWAVSHVLLPKNQINDVDETAYVTIGFDRHN